MIAQLSGKVVWVEGSSVVVDVAGVGYRVSVPTRIVGNFSRDTEALLYTHQVVREDDISLYGFQTREECHLFSVLLSVSGIGPKVALALLSGFPLEKLVTSITQGQSELITTIPGVGRKTAERLIVELREKVAKLFGGMGGDGREMTDMFDPSLRDAVAALVTLGFSPRDAREAIQKSTQKTGGSVEEVVRGALRGIR